MPALKKPTPEKTPANGVTPKPSALDAFATPKTDKKQAVSQAQEAAPGGNGVTPKTDARLGKTVRFSKAQWRRLRIVETDLEMTFQALCFEGLNRILAEHGLDPL
jgi:hypothetical protein